MSGHRRHVIVGTAGHIDHGKSALVRALTGTDPDRLKEEKARGITIDLGFAHYDDGDLHVAFVDVPGHERFVRNMLAGATGIDLVVLVIAADESVMPQTREHFEICRLLGVRRGVVALSKVDLVDEEMVELARLEARELVAGSFLEGAPVIAVSSVTGQGLDELRAALRAQAALAPPEHRASAPFRLPIDRVFTVKGFGTVVTGTLIAGELAVDRAVTVLPAGREAKIRGLQVHGAAAAVATAGQRVAVNVGGVPHDEIARGDLVAPPGTFEPTRRVDARIELLGDAKPLRHGARVRFHHGTSEVLGRVALSSLVGATAGSEPDGSEVPPGREAYVRLRLEGPVVVARGDRFILRAYSPPSTIAGGTVLDGLPPRGAIRSAAGRARFVRLDSGAGSASDEMCRAIEVMVEETGPAGLPLASLPGRFGIGRAAIEGAIGEVTRAGRITKAGDRLVATERLARLEEALVAALRDHHAREPLSEGLPREEARERVFRHAHPAVFEHVVETLARRGQVSGRERLALSTHRVALSDDERRVAETIEQLLERAGLRPPDPSELAAAAGAPAPTVDRISGLLVRQKRLVRIDQLLFHAAALERLKEEIRRMNAGATPARVDIATFKERYGVTRKYAIPLLEYLDRERVTRRVGDGRIVL